MPILEAFLKFITYYVVIQFENSSKFADFFCIFLLPAVESLECKYYVDDQRLWPPSLELYKIILYLYYSENKYISLDFTS